MSVRPISNWLPSNFCRYSPRIFVASAASRMEMPFFFRASSRRSPMVCMVDQLQVLRGRERRICQGGAPGRLGVEVPQYLAGARSVLGPDDPLLLHHLHDARRAVVADPEAALQHRGARPAGGLEDVERLRVQLLVAAHVALVPLLDPVVVPAGVAV